MTIRFDAADLDLDAALAREWLVTNGIGGYASGTIAGINSRRYHGLLIAAIDPPVNRMVLLGELEEWLLPSGAEPVGLSAQEYWDGTIFPDGFRRLQSVAIVGMLPCFRWRVGDRVIEKRIWMDAGVNRTVVAYRLVDGDAVTLRLRPLFAHRDYHAQRHGPGGFDIAETNEGWIVDASGVRSYLEARSSPVITSQPDWYWRVMHRAERERGLDFEEDLFTPGFLELQLQPGMDAVVSVGTDPLPPAWNPAASSAVAERRQSAGLGPTPVSSLATQLSIAAEQFRVGRNGSRSVIAGYHWFTDWGRDSMISLAGLAMRPGSLWEARAVLETNFKHLEQGLIPNRFPDQGEKPVYDTMDATLWMFQALSAYLRASGDWRFIAEKLDAIEGIIDWHRRGTYHNIQVDDVDGLLAGGEEGYALTWMDAKVEGWVVTPRRGKPIEINALWYNALRLTAEWCERARRPAGDYRALALQAYESAQERYWFGDGGYLYDCIDGPDGDDRSLRPNQVVALALVHPLIEGDRARSALDVVTRELLTPFGLRTLARDEAGYRPSYQGDQRSRDAAYHMGMAWPWLLGPYLDARRRLCPEARSVDAFLEPFLEHLREAGVGTISEIFEPEPPYRPVGCIAQAWSVAELLRQALS